MAITPADPLTRLDELVRRQAEKTPDAPALVEGWSVITYSSLLQQSRRLAVTLRARGVGREDLVAICVDRSSAQIISVLGVLLSGAAYVPIDPTGPPERCRFMLDDSRPRAIVIRASDRDAVPSDWRHAMIVVDHVTSAAPEPDVLELPIGSPQDLAYVIYTSGSTGVPKGVLNQHDGVANHLVWMAEAFPLSPANRVLGKTPATFDVSVWEWFWPLSQGACLVISPAGTERDPSHTIDAIESHAITDIHFVPTMLRVVLERQDLARCGSLRRVFCSGEELTADLRCWFFSRMPGPPALINLYGPTETAIHVTGWTCAPEETGLVPIGRALPNVRAYVVNDHMKLVPQGVRGELLIGGIQVARGYLGRPELTRERFISDPFRTDDGARCYRTGDCVSERPDGTIDFFGRFDSQVQIGGVRVELGEIESALRRHPAVADAAAVVRERGGTRQLVAYLRRRAPRGADPDPTVDNVRNVLARTLPDLMIPSRYVWLDTFPVTPTGKVDRRALPDPDSARASIDQIFDSPRPGIETSLAQLWCAELRIDRAGRHDDFRLLGGDSLATIRMSERIRRTFGIDLPPSELARLQTIAAVASRLDAGASDRRTGPIITLRAGHDPTALYLPPSFGGEVFYGRELAAALAPGRAVYGLALPDEGEGPVDLRTLAEMLVRKLIAFQPDGPYHLAGYSFSAGLAFEMAQQLRAAGRAVGVLAMIDYGPGLASGWSTRVQTAGHFMRNLPYWLYDDILQAGWSDLAARMWRKAAGIGKRAASVGRTQATPTAERAVDEMFDRDRLPEAYRRLAIRNLDAFYRYRPTVYEGRVLLFWARCRPLFHSLAPRLGWEHYARGGVDRIVVACNHDNILSAPHASAIAAGLDHALRAWDIVNAREPDLSVV